MFKEREFKQFFRKIIKLLQVKLKDPCLEFFKRVHIRGTYNYLNKKYCCIVFNQLGVYVFDLSTNQTIHIVLFHRLIFEVECYQRSWCAHMKNQRFSMCSIFLLIFFCRRDSKFTTHKTTIS